MNEPLFDGIHKVPNEIVIKKMKYFIDRANKLMELYEEDKRATVILARELRNELRVEYKNNDLIRIEKAYNNHELFSRYYRPAVAEAYTKTTGQLTERKAFSFLWDVDSYMNYYMPEKH
ncbi:hypothetical protein [Virgibacillus sp. YIM 98842]|uniref:hypothetical protein n=1 Tax=Virgibacillus sp. YIM 98842 TaxID=2663533 RepID=UPI0013DADB1B|nr:hypothetical protein [Virgibacillus sp. YIM 98842]